MNQPMADRDSQGSALRSIFQAVVLWALVGTVWAWGEFALLCRLRTGHVLVGYGAIFVRVFARLVSSERAFGLAHRPYPPMIAGRMEFLCQMVLLYTGLFTALGILVGSILLTFRNLRPLCAIGWARLHLFLSVTAALFVATVVTLESRLPGGFLLAEWGTLLRVAGSALFAIAIGACLTRLLGHRRLARLWRRMRPLPILLLLAAICSMAFVGRARLDWLRRYEEGPSAEAGGHPVTAGIDRFRGRNLVLISLDTVRADHLGCYGYGRETTPHLDALASESILFRKAWANSSWTLPSHATLFTSLMPSVHGAVETWYAVPDTATLLAEILQSAGYATSAVITGHNVSSHFGFERGFDHFDDEDLMQNADEVTSKGIGLLPDKESRPFFLFLHYFDAHTPYDPPAEYLSRFESRYSGSLTGRTKDTDPLRSARVKIPDEDLQHLLALYDGELRFQDDQLGLFLDALRNRGLMEGTLIVVMSDHGEEFKEHGMLFHGFTLYEEVLRIPLVLYLPGVEAREIEAQVSLLDVMPTILDLLALPVPRECEGRNLAPFLLRGAPLKDAPIHAENSRRLNEIRSVAYVGWKYIQNQRYGSEELFDARHDPAEGIDLSAAEHRRTEAARRRVGLRAQTDIWRRAGLGLGSYSQISNLDAETLHQLERIGYAR